MPTSLVFQLRPTARAQVPANLGRAAHAMVLARIGADDPALAARLHADQTLKPLTVSNILGLDAQRLANRALAQPAQAYSLRVTLLSDPLESLADRWLREPWGPIELGDLSWQVERITADATAHPWAGRESYEALAEHALRRVLDAPCQWELEFISPITFRSGPINHPLPLPDLVFRSLLDRWNAFASVPLPPEIADGISSLVVSSFDLRSVATPTKGGALQIGALGRCSYRMLGSDSAWLAGIDLLARFAIYSGIGAGTARGFGQTRLLTAQPGSTASRKRAALTTDKQISC